MYCALDACGSARKSASPRDFCYAPTRFNSMDFCFENSALMQAARRVVGRAA
jgi:hypothetical protein